MGAPQVSVERLTPLDERYISNVVLQDAMTATATLFLEGASLLGPGDRFDEEAIRARIDAATWAAPALRKRLMRTPLGLRAPAWVPVERLDLGYHVVFHPGLVSAEDGSAMSLLSGRAQPRLDTRRPMWRITVVALDSGLVVLVFTWHHVLGDAAYGQEVLRRIFTPAPGLEPRPASDDERRGLGRAPRSGWELWRALRSDDARPARPAPLARRARRWASRVGRPVKDALIVRSPGYRDLPVKTSRLVRLPLQVARQTATAAGGSLTDLTVAATLAAVLAQRPRDSSATLLVPISRRRDAPSGGQRNVMSATLVTVAAGHSARDLVPEVRRQIAAGVRGRGIPDGARVGYATMVATDESERWFGAARIVAVAGWPAGDPRDQVGVLATSFADELTVAITISSVFDADAFASAVASAIVGGDGGGR